MPRTIFAFNGDLESRLALHWLVHEQGHQVIAVSINLGQDIYLEPLGELALELGAVAAQVLDRREEFLSKFALPSLQAGAVYQSSCFLGSALGRYVIAQELVRLARDEGCRVLAHSAAYKGNDQVRMETAIAALDPSIEVVTPVRQWNLKTLEEKRTYARRRRIPLEEPKDRPITIDRNLWGASIFLDDLVDSWTEPPPEVYTLTRGSTEAPDEPAVFTIGFTHGVPDRFDGQPMSPLSLVKELTKLGGEHGVGRYDVVEDRLFGIKTREFYEAPTPTILMMAHRDLESLVQSRELIQMKDLLGSRYAELVYSGLWFHDLRRSLQEFVEQSQQFVSGEVRMRLHKGTCAVLGRRSPHSLYDSRLANQTNLEWFDSRWVQGFASLWTLPSRQAARRQRIDSEQPGGWALP